jgi:zinc protease
MMKNKAFDAHTYKHTTMGFFDDIVDMPNQYEYSLKFFDRYYKPEYCTIITVGDVDVENVNLLAEKYFGDWERGSYISTVPVEPVQKETRYVHLQEGSIPPYMQLNFKGPAFDDTKIDMPALDVLSQIVFSQTSDLYKKLVLQERKVRFVGGGAFDSRDPNLFSITSSLINKEDMQYVKDEIIKAIEDVKVNGVDKETLEIVKSNLKYSFAMRIDTPDAIAGSLSHYIQLTGDPEAVNRIYDLYEKVTVEDVKMVTAKYFVPSGLTVATISDMEMGGVK